MEKREKIKSELKSKALAYPYSTKVYIKKKNLHLSSLTAYLIYQF